MKALNKMKMREAMETQIRAHFKAIYPHFEMEQQIRKMPTCPKIVVYSNLTTPVQEVLSQLFPHYKYWRPSISQQSDQIITRSIANEMVNGEEFVTSPGVIIEGFPFNKSQALLLDRFLNGVNLALHIKTGECVSPSYSDLLNYYDQTGTLLQLNQTQFQSLEQMQKTSRQIFNKFKLTQF